MKNIAKKELNRISKEYGYDPQYLEDQVLDWERDSIRVDAHDTAGLFFMHTFTGRSDADGSERQKTKANSDQRTGRKSGQASAE